MEEKPHVILGVTPNTFKKIESLQTRGNKEIYVMDYDQSSKVKEENGVMYISPEVAARIFNQNTDVVLHFYTKRPAGRPRNKKRPN